MQTSLSFARRSPASPPETHPTVAAVSLPREYENCRAETLAASARLFAERDALLASGEWDAAHAAYRRQAERLRDLGDRVRPRSLRDPAEELSGADLAAELIELFA